MRLLPLLAVLAVALAGCAQPPPGPGDGAGPGGPPAPVARADPATVVAANPYRDRETDVAIDPLDPMHVAVFYNERPQPYLTGSVATDPIRPGTIRQALAVSRDGGATWTRQPLPVSGEAPPGSPWNLYCAMGDPNVVFDDEGTIHVVTLFIGCGGPLFTSTQGILHATTRDDGATWSDPTLAWPGGGGLAGLFHDREWTAYDRATGTLGIVWTSIQAGGNRVVLSAIFSTDGGDTWTLPEEILALGPVEATLNFLVHALWGADGKFHITAFGCPQGTLVDGTAGSCLWHFAGSPGGPWARSEMPLASCPGAPSGAFDYAASSVDMASGRIFAASPVLHDGRPQGAVCVFASDDHGATWPRAALVPGADHPWLAVAADGSAALAYLALDGTMATPTMALLDPLTLAPRSTAALAPAYEADTDGDGLLEYGDYDGMALSGGRFVWALTRPNDEGRRAAPNEAWNDLDVWAYRGTAGP